MVYPGLCDRRDCTQADHSRESLDDVEVPRLLMPHQWRYTHLALQFLSGLLRRDIAPSPSVARLFINHTLSPHAPLRATAQKSVHVFLIRWQTFIQTTQPWQRSHKVVGCYQDAHVLSQFYRPLAGRVEKSCCEIRVNQKRFTVPRLYQQGALDRG